jgi:hypothetical protein
MKKSRGSLYEIRVSDYQLKVPQIRIPKEIIELTNANLPIVAFGSKKK